MHVENQYSKTFLPFDICNNVSNAWSTETARTSTIMESDLGTVHIICVQNDGHKKIGLTSIKVGFSITMKIIIMATWEDIPWRISLCWCIAVCLNSMAIIKFALVKLTWKLWPRYWLRFMLVYTPKPSYWYRLQWTQRKMYNGLFPVWNEWAQSLVRCTV